MWGGLSGNLAFGEEMKGKFRLYLNGRQFLVVLVSGAASLAFTENLYRVKWDIIESIFSIHSDHYSCLPTSVWQNPEVSQPLLDGMILNEFLKILTDVLTVYGGGHCNVNIHNPIDVQFVF